MHALAKRFVANFEISVPSGILRKRYTISVITIPANVAQDLHENLLHIPAPYTCCGPQTDYLKRISTYLQA